ncbi:PH domain-containing protein [Sphingomonas sp.]
MVNDAPRRLHPATLAVAILYGAPSTLIGLPIALRVVSDVGWPVTLAIVSAVVGAMAAIRYAAWRRFTYRLTDSALLIDSGILARNHREIPLRRVQDVDIERRPLQRLFGLARVTFETAGSGEDEATLDSVSLDEAARLRDAVRARAAAIETMARTSESATGDAHAESPVAIPAAPVLFAMPVGRVLHWGLFNFSLVWLAVLGGGLQYLDDWFGFEWWTRGFWRSVGAQVEPIGATVSPAWGLLLVALGMLGVAAGLIRTLLRDYGFTLTDEDTRLRRSRGLLTHSEVVIALRRVQLAAIDHGWLRRRLGWARLRVQTLTGGEGASKVDLAPHARVDEIEPLLARLSLAALPADAMERVSQRHVWRAVLHATGLPGLALLVAAAFNPLFLLLSPALAVALVHAVLRRRHHRHAIDSHRLHVQAGVLTRTQWIVPVGHVQVLTLKRSPLQRLLGTASLYPDTAGGAAFGGPAIRDVRLATAWNIVARLREERQLLGRVHSDGSRGTPE